MNKILWGAMGVIFDFSMRRIQGALAEPNGVAPSEKNVVIIFADDLGYSHFLRIRYYVSYSDHIGHYVLFVFGFGGHWIGYSKRKNAKENGCFRVCCFLIFGIGPYIFIIFDFH